MLRRVLAALVVSSYFATFAQAAPKSSSKSAPAPAQAASVDDEATKKAKVLFKQAETDFSLGRFQYALDNYSKAYEAKALPAFLFNIGQCHMELGNYERAIFFYEQYLRGDVDARKRALVNKRLEEARIGQARVEAEDQKRREEAEERERQELAARAQESARLAAMQQAENDARMLQITTQQASAPVYKKWWFWAAAAGVAAVAATTVIILTRETKTELPSGDLPTIDARQPL